MNFYPFHPGDYTLRTGHLDLIEDLAYRRLIDLYYLNEAPLKGDIESIARVIRMRSNSAEVGSVLGEFFTETPDGWRHPHCDGLIAKYHAKAKQAAENGKLGGRPKKPSNNPDGSKSKPSNNPEETQPVISANPEETGSKTNQEPRTNNQNQVDQEQVTAVALHSAAVQVEQDVNGEDSAQTKPQRAKRLPPNWTLPPDWMAWAATDRPEFTSDLLAREGEKFADHFHSISGSKAARLDWFATWRNWIRSARPPANVHPFPQQSRFVNLPQVNAEEIRAKTEENAKLGVSRANF